MWRLFYIGVGMVLSYFLCDKVKRSVTISVYATKELMADKEKLKNYVEQEIRRLCLTGELDPMIADIQAGGGTGEIICDIDVIPSEIQLDELEKFLYLKHHLPKQYSNINKQLEAMSQPA